MDLTRKIDRQLTEWKRNPAHKPLLIRGPRQCGKTHSVLKFAHENYTNVVYLNFLEEPKYQAAFAGSLKMDEIILQLSTLLDNPVPFVPHETVLVFDEIQDCPEARTALKFICLDGRFDVISTGSLLGVTGYGKEPRSIPVGYENYLTMHPLDFEEFLWASQVPDSVIESLKDHLKREKPLPKAVHLAMRDHLFRYAIVGGMPEVVKTFLQTKDLRLVRNLQREIVTAYRADMVRYAAREDRPNITECFDSIPVQLGCENKKFRYTLVRKGSRGRDFIGSLQWIEDAGIAMRCWNVSIPEIPLEGVRLPDQFKVYLNDPGLFMGMLAEDAAAEILHGNFSAYKGSVFENLVAGMLHKCGRRLYYYHKHGGIELDFLLSRGERCVPIEIKATTGNAKSLRIVLNHPEKYHVESALKFGDYQIGREGALLTLPTYLLPFCAF